MRLEASFHLKSLLVMHVWLEGHQGPWSLLETPGLQTVSPFLPFSCLGGDALGFLKLSCTHFCQAHSPTVFSLLGSGVHGDMLKIADSSLKVGPPPQDS